MKDIEKKIVRGSSVEKLERKVKRELLNELKYGYYVTCIEAFNKEEVTNDHTEREISLGSHWLVSPEEKTEDTSISIRSTKDYVLYYAERRVNTALNKSPAFFGNGHIVIKGSLLEKYFTRGFLKEKKIEMKRRTCRIIPDTSPDAICRYTARDVIHDNRIMAGDNISELLKEVSSHGYTHLQYTNKNGKRIEYPIENCIEKEPMQQ